jgi:uncharacterized membrane protein YjgN (DUF898 family)
VNRMSSVPAYPPLPVPASVSFSGRRGEFFNLVARGAGLELLTFGFYRFWLATDVRRHLWSHTSVGGDAPEYTGRGKELLIGFLFALAILVPIYLAYFLIGIEVERYRAFASFPLFLFFYLFGQFAIYRARRYRLTRTVWRGVRFWMDGSGWAYAARAAGWALLTLLTLGLALPWREAALERYKMRHCHYGDLQGSFEGRGWEFFKSAWRFWLMALLPPLVAMFIAPLSRSAGLPPGAGPVAGLLLVLWILCLPSIYGMFKAAEWRWWISGIRFGEVSFESDLSKGALHGLYWKVIGWFLLNSVLLMVCLFAFGRFIAGFSDLSLAAARLQSSTSMVVASAVGYLVFILSLNVVLRTYLLRDVWARVAASTTVRNLEAVADVAAKGELAGALGEGLTGDLDVVGF